MSINIKGVAQRALASLTMTSTVLGLAGFAALTPTVALAGVVPADYGLLEGDVISAQPSDPDIYIVNDWGYKRLFLNPVIFNFYGHIGWASVKTVAPATRDAFGTSGIFRNCETGDQRVWGLEVTGEDTGVLHWINMTGAQAVTEDPQFFLKVFCINTNEFNWYAKGSDYTSLNQIPPYSRGGPAGPTPTPGPGGPLQGGAGSLQAADFIASLNNEEVGEGESNIAVTGLDLEADSGSDLRVTSVRVALEQVAGGAESEDLDDYADQVSLWFNGARVATANVSDFSEDANVWSRSISLTGDAVIRMSQIEDLRVALSALDVIDSTDLATNAWEIAIENVRYVDAQGAITTEATLGDIGTLTAGNGGAADRDFSFESFASAADLELSLNEATDNPDARVVNIDDSATTDDVLLLTGDLEAEGGDIMVLQLTVSFATGSGGSAFDVITDSVNLEVDGDVVQTLSSSACTTSGSPAVASCVFDDVDVEILEGDTAKVRVLADINGTDVVTPGSSLTATINNDAAGTDAEDQNGDDLAAADLTGAANGEAQSFYDEGIQLTFVSGTASVTPNDSPTPDLGTFVITFDARAFDTAAYLDFDCADMAATASTGNGVLFANTGSGSVQSCVVDSNADQLTNTFEILEGATERFTLTVAIEGGNAFEVVNLTSVNWATQSATAADQYYTFDLENYKTSPPVFVGGI